MIQLYRCVYIIVSPHANDYPFWEGGLIEFYKVTEQL